MGILNWITKEETKAKIKRKQIFICFANKDVGYRNYLARQANKEKLPIDFFDMATEGQLTEDQWKTSCRTKIKQCDGVIVLLSKNTYDAKDAKFELQCMLEENIPVLAMHLQKENKGLIPLALKGKPVMDWHWESLERFIGKL